MGAYNCAALICCDPLKALEAITELLVKHGCSEEAAKAAAPAVQAAFDLAPKGTLQPFMNVIADLARGKAYEGRS